MNTRIYYSYRDASNYKSSSTEVLYGAITDEQKDIICSCLDEEEYFIPVQVGLPDGSEIASGFIPNSQDHNWSELEDDNFETTKDNPTIAMTVSQLTKAFETAKENWDDSLLYLPSEEELEGMHSFGEIGDNSLSFPEAEIAVWVVAYNDYSGKKVQVRRTIVGSREEAKKQVMLPHGDQDYAWEEAYTQQGFAAARKAWKDRGYVLQEREGQEL